MRRMIDYMLQMTLYYNIKRKLIESWQSRQNSVNELYTLRNIYTSKYLHDPGDSILFPVPVETTLYV